MTNMKNIAVVNPQNAIDDAVWFGVTWKNSRVFSTVKAPMKSAEYQEI